MNGIIADNIVTRTTLKALHDKRRVVIHQGGAHSGKTFGNMLAIYLYAYESTERKVITVVSLSNNHLKSGAYNDFRTIDAHLGLCSKENNVDRRYQIGKSEIHFTSFDDVGKARGPKRDILFLNEADRIDWAIALQLHIRTNDTTILDFNPVSFFWVHDKLLPGLQQEDYVYKITTYKDNPSISETKVKELENLKNIDEQYYRIYTLGMTGQITGLVYDNINIVDDMPNELRKEGIALDFGFSNDETAMVHCGLHSGEIYVNELVYETGLTNNDIYNRIKSFNLGRHQDIIADSAEPKSIEELRRLGLRVKPCKKGRDSVIYGIQLMKGYKINITKQSANIIREFQNYRWKVDNNDKPLNVPVDNFNHSLDAIRYWLTTMVGDKKLTSHRVRVSTKY